MSCSLLWQCQPTVFRCMEQRPKVTEPQKTSNFFPSSFLNQTEVDFHLKRRPSTSTSNEAAKLWLSRKKRNGNKQTRLDSFFKDGVQMNGWKPSWDFLWTQTLRLLPCLPTDGAARIFTNQYWHARASFQQVRVQSNSYYPTGLPYALGFDDGAQN